MTKPTDKKKEQPSPKKPAARRATKKARPAPAQNQSSSDKAKRPHSAGPTPDRPHPRTDKDGAQELKEGVSKLFSRGRALISEKGPGVLTSIERVTHKAIDQTSKGITAFERATNEAEAKLGRGIKEMLNRRRENKGDDPSSGPKR